MLVLVVGGCGFIGSHVVDSLLRKGTRVRVFDRQAERYRAAVPGVDYRFGNYLDRMALIDAMAGVDAVIHLVSTTMPGTANFDPQADIQGNLIGSISLIEAMLSLDIRRIIYLSSGGTVYGIPDQVPIPETHPLRPINSYGIVKVAIEHYIEMYRRTRGISPVVLRASNPYGPRQAHVGVQGVVSTFLRRAQEHEPIEVWGDGSVQRDFIHVGDLSELCALAVGSDAEGTFNAGTGHGASINEIIAHVAAVSGHKIETRYKSGRLIDTPRSVLDVTLAQRTFDWAARTALRDGIAETWAWMTQTG